MARKHHKRGRPSKAAARRAGRAAVRRMVRGARGQFLRRRR